MEPVNRLQRYGKAGKENKRSGGVEEWRSLGVEEFRSLGV
jgi:hypothetical protein